MPDADPPPSIPDYELLKRIGGGGYGDVWLARGMTGTHCAIKVVSRKRFTTPEPYEREFKGLKKFAPVTIHDPRQLAVLHVGSNESAGYFYYVMELADDVRTGPVIDAATYAPHTLRQIREEHGHLPTSEVIRLGIELAEALGALHRQELIHRDIKPSNIIIVRGRAKFADVGLVAPTDDAKTFCGTEGYVPPEGPGTRAGDLFSLGRVLYELATGNDRKDFPRLPDDLDERPDRKELLELNEVLLRAGEPDFHQRYASAEKLLADLRLLQAGVSVARMLRLEQNLKSALRVAAGLAIIALIAGGGVYAERRRVAEETARRKQVEAERDALTRRNNYSSTLMQAQRALEQDDYDRARQLLDGENCPPALRGLEWQALRTRAQGDPNTILLSQATGPRGLVLDPGGQRIAALTADNTVRLLRTDDGTTLRAIDNVNQLAGFSRNGAWLIGLSADPRKLVRWSVERGEPAGMSPVDPQCTTLGVDAHDRALLFRRAPSSSVALVNVETGREEWKVDLASEEGAPAWELFRGAVAPDGTQAILFCIQGRGSAARWRLLALDLARRQVRWNGPPPGLPTAVGCLELAGAFLVSTGMGGRLYRLDPGTDAWHEVGNLNREPTMLLERRGVAGHLWCDHNAPVIAEVDLATLSPLRRWHGHSGRVEAMCESPDGKTLFTCAADGQVRRWDLTTPARSRLTAWWFENGVPPRLIPSPDGARLLVPFDGHSSSVISTENWQAITHWPDLGQPIAWNGDRIWALTSDSRVAACWRVGRDETPQREYALHLPDEAQFEDFAVAKEGTFVVGSSGPGLLHVWDAGSAKSVGTIQAHHDTTWALCFADGGHKLWSLGNDSTLTRSDLASCRIEITVPTEGRGPGLVLSADGRTLLLVRDDGRLEFRSAATGAVQSSHMVSPGYATFAQLSRDGSRLLVGGPAGSLTIVAADTGAPITTFAIPTSTDVAGMALAPDERWLALFDGEGSITPWRLR